MLRLLPGSILLGLVFLWSDPVLAFHCGTRLVHEGDTRAEVLAKCGEPTDVDVRTVLRRPIMWLHGRPFFGGFALVEIPIEFWLYNLGPHKLMRRLRFEDGELVQIETLGHGFIDTRDSSVISRRQE